jgi:hypothetical protein
MMRPQGGKEDHGRSTRAIKPGAAKIATVMRMHTIISQNQSMVSIPAVTQTSNTVLISSQDNTSYKILSLFKIRFKSHAIC